MIQLMRTVLSAAACAALLAGCSGADRQVTSGAANAAPITIATSSSLSPTPKDTPTPTQQPSPTNTSASIATPSATPVIAQTPAAISQAQVYTYKVINTYPHRTDAFTQGLLYVDGSLYESTGLRGDSTLRKVDLESGEPLQVREAPFPADVLCGGEPTYTACFNQTETGQLFFAEGLAAREDRLYQLTWQGGIGFIYERESFELLDTFTLPAEGWGLTYDGEQLVLSDGTDKLTLLDPETLLPTGQVTVHDGEKTISLLNELEYVNGEVWANIWKSERLVRIDPHSGTVTGWVVLSGLLAQAASAAEPGGRVDVLNGIAYDPDSGRLFVTGKWWPLLFEIELIPDV
jgi:glutaminyl-peptide cyclotransferase